MSKTAEEWVRELLKDRDDHIFYLVIGFDQFLHVSTMFILLKVVVG